MPKHSFPVLCCMIPLTALALLAPSGCETIPLLDSGSSNEENPELMATVKVEDPDYGGKTPIVVIMSSTKYRDAIGKLRTEKWNEAIAILDERIESERNRDRLAEAYFAKGVAHEVQGEYQPALDAYEAAYERGNRAEYKDGIDRAKSGLDS